jgi:glutamate synthase domain-containing protein 3
MILGTFAYFRRKTDGLEERVIEMAAIYVTRNDLAALEQKLDERAKEVQAAKAAMHLEDSNNFREMRLQLESVNSKLFQLAGNK